jgi:hypothetical protein
VNFRVHILTEEDGLIKATVSRQFDIDFDGTVFDSKKAVDRAQGELLKALMEAVVLSMGEQAQA